MIVTLDEAKLQCRVDNDAEDGLIQIYIGAAEDYIRNFLDRDLPTTTPYAIKAAALLIIADLYDVRESQVIGDSIQENPAVKRLLRPYREGMGV